MNNKKKKIPDCHLFSKFVARIWTQKKSFDLLKFLFSFSFLQETNLQNVLAVF